MLANRKHRGENPVLPAVIGEGSAGQAGAIVAVVPDVAHEIGRGFRAVKQNVRPIRARGNPLGLGCTRVNDIIGLGPAGQPVEWDERRDERKHDAENHSALPFPRHVDSIPSCEKRPSFPILPESEKHANRVPRYGISVPSRYHCLRSNGEENSLWSKYPGHGKSAVSVNVNFSEWPRIWNSPLKAWGVGD